MFSFDMLYIQKMHNKVPCTLLLFVVLRTHLPKYLTIKYTSTFYVLSHRSHAHFATFNLPTIHLYGIWVYIKYSITTNPNVHEVFGILAPRFKTPTSVDDEFSVKPSRESIFQQCTKQNTKKLTCSPHHVHNFSVMFRLENQTLEVVFCFQKTPPFQLSVRFH